MDVSGLFPVKERCAYLNCAAVGPLSTPARDAMRKLVDDQWRDGVRHYERWFSVYQGCRDAAARLIGASADEIALVSNTSAGLSTIAQGLHCARGDNVVIPEAEFPANVYPWLALPGVEVRRVPKREGSLRVEDVAARINGRTRAVSVSFVDWLTGHRANLAAMGAAAHAYGALFIVDAIQGLGALALDVAATGIDALAADGHKWMCGPEGAGLLYVRRDARERILPTRPSWLSVRHPTRFLEYDLAPHPTARRYEDGTPNTAGIHGLQAALRLLLDTGPAVIEARVLALAALVRTQARARGIVLACEPAEGEDSGIVSLRIENASVLAEALEARGIIVAAREGLLRIATHWFNDEEEIARLFEAIA